MPLASIVAVILLPLVLRAMRTGAKGAVVKGVTVEVASTLPVRLAITVAVYVVPGSAGKDTDEPLVMDPLVCWKK